MFPLSPSPPQPLTPPPWRWLFPLLLGLLLTACSRPQPVTLRVGPNAWLGYEPLYLARDLGLYGDRDIQLQRFASATETMRAFSEKRIEAAALTLDEALALAQFEKDISIVLVFDFSHGADALLARPEIRSLDDLKGRSIGVESSAVGAYMLQRALDRAGLSEQEVKVVSINVDGHEAAYTGGQVEAVITFEPIRSRLLARGAKVLFDSSMIPGEIIDVLVVREACLRSHPELVGHLLSGWFAALDELKVRPAAAAGRMRASLGLTPEAILQGFQGLRLPERQENWELLLGSPPRLLGPALRLEEVMLDKRLLYSRVEPHTMLDEASLARLYRP